MLNMLKKLPNIFTKERDTELGSIVGSLENSLETSNKDLDLLEEQYNLNTATGSWLDIWGDWFGVLRNSEENDEYYRNRIMATTLMPKSTIPALISAVRGYLGDDQAYVNIYEPYMDLFVHNVSNWGDQNFYPDISYHSRGVVEIQSYHTTTPELTKLISEIHSAGIKVVYSLMGNIGGGSGEVVEMFSYKPPKTEYERQSTMFSHWIISPTYWYSDVGYSSGERILWGIQAHSESFLTVLVSPVLSTIQDYKIEDIKDYLLVETINITTSGLHTDPVEILKISDMVSMNTLTSKISTLTQTKIDINNTELALTITASSEVLLSSIWEERIEDVVSSTEDVSQLPIESITTLI